MAPALIETMAQNAEGKFEWHPIGVLHAKEGEIVQSPLGSVALLGTETGFTVHTGEHPVDHVDVGDTDDFDQPNTTRTFTGKDGLEIRVSAITEEAADTVRVEEKK